MQTLSDTKDTRGVEIIWHWHCHGTTGRSAMCHLSIKPPGETDWDAPWRDWDTYTEGAR